MCGRYTLIRLADFLEAFPWIRLPGTVPPARYNIAPSQPIAAVSNEGCNEVQFMRWGLIPFWAKDPSIGNRMINARVESLAHKPVFRGPLERRRCVIPASGFYEWRKNLDRTKTPMYIRRRDGKSMVFAGLWERWNAPDGSEVPTCTIITGRPNSLVATIHDRMPMILRDDAVKRWIEPGEMLPQQLLHLLEPYPDDALEAHPVSMRVNRPTEDSPLCIESITEQAPPGVIDETLFP
jgi:putative SOS response-associated peptidase YedK